MAMAFLLALSLCLSASAMGHSPSLEVSDSAGDVIYHANGTVTCGSGNGTLTVSNPAAVSCLSSVNVTMYNGTSLFIDRISPGTSYSINYTIGQGDLKLPLKLREAITPSTLTGGAPQQLRLCIELENVGDAGVAGFKYQKNLPPGLAVAWTAYDGGVLCVNDTVTWTLDGLGPGEARHLAIAFNLTPASDVYFPGAYVWLEYGASLTGRCPGFSGSTDTAFRIQKSRASAGSWLVNASVPGDSEFTIVLKNVSVDRSDAADPFDTCTIAGYKPNMILEPGCAWDTSLIDDYGLVPAYFIKISYTIPYTLGTTSRLSARTDPFTVSVPASGQQPNVPHVTGTPTALPSPPPAEPDIVFVLPGDGDVIIENTTLLLTSVPPSSDPGYVAYYGSADNGTWIKLGEAPVSGNMSRLTWAVPPENGKYYLKAEHYNAWGLRGVAYTRVLIAHEISPVDMETRLVTGQDWMMLSLALVAFILMLFLITPYFLKTPVVYDTSALRALSSGESGGRASKLSDKAIRPEVLPAGLENFNGIPAVVIKNIEEAARLEREYALGPYDARALRLAKETGAVVYTDDPRVRGICGKIGVKARRIERPGPK